jgi:hypothetical protein
VPAWFCKKLRRDWGRGRLGCDGMYLPKVASLKSILRQLPMNPKAPQRGFAVRI